MPAYRKVLQTTINHVDPAKSTVDVAYYESEEAFNAGKVALKESQLQLGIDEKTADGIVAVAEELLDYVATDFAIASKTMPEVEARPE